MHLSQADVVSLLFVFFKQKTAYELRISDWSSDVCSADLQHLVDPLPHRILQFSIFAGLLAPGVERPAESGESEEPPKAGEQQSTDNRADDRGDRKSTRPNSSH